MRRLLVLIMAVALAGVVPAQASTGERKVVADGHVDLGPRFVDGAWTIQIRDDTAQPVVWRDLADVVWHAVDTAMVTAPPDAAFAFLGEAGAKVWVLPQVQQAGILWPGWNTQDHTVIGAVNRDVTWILHRVSGPGHFALFLNGSFGAPRILFDSAKSYPQETGIEPASHVHGNWAFSAPGTYVLDIELAATTVDGALVRDRRPLRIFVGPGDPIAAFATPVSGTPPPQPASTPPPPTSAGVPPVRSAGAPAEPASNPPWLAVGAGALAVLAIGVGALVWLRRNRSRRREAR